MEATSGNGTGTYRGRFAPSPERLHLGNARTALVAWLRASAAGGTFVLRVEDLDPPRTRPEAVTGNLEELRWLGLDWDEGPDVGGPYGPYLQSQRLASYEAALRRLGSQGRLFECFLSRKELAHVPQAPHGSQPVYGARQRRANAAIRDQKRAQGVPPSLRFHSDEHRLEFVDVFAGRQQLDVESEVGDVVVRRADGLWAYQLAVVVDDHAMGISEVVRADDLLPATGAQLLLHRALGHTPPAYLHLPLLLDETGERLAKRRGSRTLHALREDGAAAERVVGWLAYTLGQLDQPRSCRATSLIRGFDLARVPRAPWRMSFADAEWLRGRD